MHTVHHTYCAGLELGFVPPYIEITAQIEVREMRRCKATSSSSSLSKDRELQGGGRFYFIITIKYRLIAYDGIYIRNIIVRQG